MNEDILDKRNLCTGENTNCQDDVNTSADTDVIDNDDFVPDKTGSQITYWITNGLGWFKQGADIYDQVKGGDTGAGVDIVDIDQADSDNSDDMKKYMMYGGIGLGVIILLLILSKVFAKKNAN